MARWTAPTLRCGAEDRAQSGLDIGYLGEFLLDHTNHLCADRHTAGGTQQLETAMKRVGEIAASRWTNRSAGQFQRNSLADH